MAQKKLKRRKSAWRKVKQVSDCIPCPDCGEAFCKEHKTHFSDCPCPGVGMPGVMYRETRYGLMARPMTEREFNIFGVRREYGQN